MYKNTQPFGRNREELCVIKNEVSCSYVAQTLTERKLLAEKCGDQDTHFQSMRIGSEYKTKNYYTV